MPLFDFYKPKINKYMKNQLYTETANAFKDKIKSYDKESQWVYTFEAKAMLNRLEASLTRLYDNNCLSQKDFEKFDSMLFARQEQIFE